MNDIYSGEPQELQEVHEHNPAELAAQFMRRQNLPKFELGENEDFYITRERLAEINRIYFQMLDDMREGFSVTPQEMRSYMESVVCVSYMSEIEKMQRRGKIDGIHKREVFNLKSSQMNPALVRRWYQITSRPNYAMSLCLKEAQLEAEIANSIYREKIAKHELFLYGSPEDNDEQSEEEYIKASTQELFDAFVSRLVPKRKRKRFIKKNGEYLSGMLEEFIRQQRAIFKLPCSENDEQIKEGNIKADAQEFFDAFVSEFVRKRKRKRFIKKNGEYLNGMLEEFIRQQFVMFKLLHKETENPAEPESEELENLVVEATEEAQTEFEQVIDETLEEDPEEPDYREYEPEEDDFSDLYELEEPEEEGELEEEESEQQSEPVGAEQQPQEPENGVSERSEETSIEETDNEK
ncbi:MAG: hypothetical protein K2L12_04015 [Clostridia bacterium]|nr:hypothetical protein [Clostridia bacterium]